MELVIVIEAEPVLQEEGSEHLACFEFKCFNCASLESASFKCASLKCASFKCASFSVVMQIHRFTT